MSTPFEPGGPVSKETIPLAVPSIGGNAWAYVKECLDSNWVSSAGPFVDRFERMVASYCGAPHAVATVNGTAALHVALQVAGVQPGDGVLLPSLTFIATANAVRYLGALPIFLDVEPVYGQLCPDILQSFLERQCDRQENGVFHRESRTRVKAVLPVHALGHPVDLDSIFDIANRYQLQVVQDAAEALGSRYKNYQIGKHGSYICFSFNGNKIITTGGGGMVVTDSPPIAHRLRYLTTQAKDDPLEYIHCEMGYNYRLTNLQAALGCAQMEQLEEFVRRKREIAARYNDAFRHIPGITPFPEASWATSNCWLYTIKIDPEKFGCGSRQLLSQLAMNNIHARPLWQPMHESPSHAVFHPRSCPQATLLSRISLSLPCSVELSAADQNKVIRVVTDLYTKSYRRCAC